ncbi:DUF1269 domain-containing protein [Undibacterium arcticum]|uniref:DUF1269 domain-containing protein n=1 Tax=Undibacterium arcticum TaxID=1762892 RepID=A0ABV7EZB4_9BURK
MRRRLYYMLPDVDSARALFDKLLLARIEERHMRFWSRDGKLPDDMPEANFMHKTDLVHGTEMGLLIGACAGLIGGSLLVLFPLEGLHLQNVVILAAALVGAIFGAWASGMVAAAIPNSRMKNFQKGIEAGQVLLIIDVPYSKVEKVEQLIQERHPEASFAGVEPHTPAFP